MMKEGEEGKEALVCLIDNIFVAVEKMKGFHGYNKIGV